MRLTKPQVDAICDRTRGFSDNAEFALNKSSKTAYHSAGGSNPYKSSVFLTLYNVEAEIFFDGEVPRQG